MNENLTTFDGGDMEFDRACGSKSDNQIDTLSITKVKANDNFVEDLPLAA
jgi:hypothetical protein